MKLTLKILLFSIPFALVVIATIFIFLISGISDKEKIVYKVNNLCIKQIKKYFTNKDFIVFHGSSITVKDVIIERKKSNYNKDYLIRSLYEDKDSPGLKNLKQAVCTARTTELKENNLFGHFDAVWIDGIKAHQHHKVKIELNNRNNIFIAFSKIFGNFEHVSKSNKEIYCINRNPFLSIYVTFGR